MVLCFHNVIDMDIGIPWTYSEVYRLSDSDKYYPDSSSLVLAIFLEVLLIHPIYCRVIPQSQGHATPCGHMRYLAYRRWPWNWAWIIAWHIALHMTNHHQIISLHVPVCSMDVPPKAAGFLSGSLTWSRGMPWRIHFKLLTFIASGWHGMINLNELTIKYDFSTVITWNSPLCVCHSIAASSRNSWPKSRLSKIMRRHSCPIDKVMRCLQPIAHQRHIIATTTTTTTTTMTTASKLTTTVTLRLSNYGALLGLCSRIYRASN